MVKFSDNHAPQSNEDMTDFKENQWPRSGNDRFWLRDDAGGDQGAVDTSRNSFVGKVIPITRRHGAISGLSLAPEADIHNRASLFNSVVSSSPSVEVDSHTYPPPRKPRNFRNTYTSRRAKSVAQATSCSVAVPRLCNRSRSSDPRNAARPARGPSNPEMIKELCVNKPNAYKSRVRLQAFEAVRNRS
ncbi:hypothetical protein BSKO_07856 [Bryopsis sp. KO-2023]|nr:hypothetical protein BSKO_07856 [Bryopsis sp. KO-2023]